MRFALVTLVACGASPSAPSRSDVEAIAARFVDAFANTTPLLTGDGRVVFVSDRDGLAQLYVGELARPEAAPIRLATGTERVVAPQLSPDGSAVFYLSDVGGDQKFHVFRIDLAGGAPADLTPGDELRRKSLHVARDSGLIAYTGHVLDDQSTHVFVQAPGGAPREIYRDALVGTLTDISADGRRVLFVRSVSHASQIAIAIDTATGAATRLYPPEDAVVAIADAELSADGASVFVASDQRGRPARVVRVDLAAREQARFDERTARAAAIAGVHPSPAGDRVVAVLDAGDHSELRILDAHDLRAIAAPAIPPGTVTVAGFSRDGTRAAVTLRGTGGPAEIAAFDLATSAVAPLRREPRTGLGDPPRASIVTLRAFDGRALPVNLYLPARAIGKRPVLVLVHGGPSSSAPISWSAPIGFWSAMGFVVIAPNIRGSSGFGIDYLDADNRERRGDAVHDIETVNRWARSQPWCDADRLVIGGISYGGYMTLLALTRQPALWRAGIDGSGMSNLVTMEQHEDQQIRAFDDTEFGVLGTDDALLREWSPIHAVDRIKAPVFVYQGVRDPVTPRLEADQIVDALRARHIPVEYMLVPDEGHGLARRANWIAYLARSYRFVASHLR